MPGFGNGSKERPDDTAPLIVARAEELDLLRQWLAEALSGSPRVIVVTGDAGIGKSRVVAEFIREANEAGVRPFAGRCIEDSQLPLFPLATALETLIGDTRAYSSDAARTSPDPNERLAVAVDTSRALMTAAADRPALLVLEDAQWADQATIELIAHVVATLAHEAVFRQLPVMLLVSRAPERTVGRAPTARPAGAGDDRPLVAPRRPRRPRRLPPPRRVDGRSTGVKPDPIRARRNCRGIRSKSNLSWPDSIEPAPSSFETASS